MTQPIIIPTVYNNPAVTTAERTAAGDFKAWQAEVFLPDGGNNDLPTENAVIKSPFHTLTVNGISVPVYTARCGKSPHSFAWIDVEAGTKASEFVLDVVLTLDERASECGKCIVLPESRGVTAVKTDTVETRSRFLSQITEYGSFTYTFAKTEADAHTDPTQIPLTLMVTQEVPLIVPDGYTILEVEAGYHGTDALEFTQSHTVYVMKPGLHGISSIGLPSDSVLYIARGAYLQVTDRKNADGSPNTKTAIHADDAENVRIVSRGLLDCGKVLGGDRKFKHVFNVGRSRNVTVEGMTVVNANTWTMCFYNSQNVTAEWNLLLSFRTYSDGIMMSECRDSAGRHNFVRTGDDAIEFKGTGWWGKNTSENCIYEHNDLWTDKGAGYCLTWESSCGMRNMVFRDNSVGFAQPTWTDRNTALDCLCGTDASVRWGDITFENIEIYHVISPNAINVQLSGAGAILDNILFRNITVSSAEAGVCAFRMADSADGGSISGITLENVNFCGKTLSPHDICDTGDTSLFRNEAAETFTGALTVV
ncbi:MAG: hypothetical protein IJ449_02420 [Clostridia bacterium]|nr:hypothetical protein [Clostridia bacterium]